MSAQPAPPGFVEWDDLRERLEWSASKLEALALEHSLPERLRISGKAQGVRLALDYMRGYGP